MVKRVRPRPEFAAEVRLAKKLREFEYPDLDTKPNPPSIGGGASVIDVAAHNAPEWEKAGARYVCDGVDDHLEIQQAIEEQFIFGSGKASETTLSSGDFYVGNGWIFVMEWHHLRGQGGFTTRIHNQDTGIKDYREALITVQQDGELSDLGFITQEGAPFESGICVSVEYGIVHDLVHFGSAWHFIYYRGTIHVTSSLDSWANYGQADPSAGNRHGYASMLAFEEGWHVATNIGHFGGGTSIWVDALGHATLTNVVITNALVNVEPDHPSPGIVLADVGGLAISNVAIRAPFSSAIESQGYSGNVQISNAVLYGAYGLSSAPGWGIGQLHMENVTIEATTSGIDAGDITELTIDGLTIRKAQGTVGSGYPILPGYGARFELALSNRKLAISNFMIGSFGATAGFEEDGLVVVPEGGATTAHVSIHDGLIENVQKHGMVLDGVKPKVHDVTVKDVGQAAANTYDAFHLKGTMDQPRLHNNDIIGAAQLRYGINISEAAIQRAIVVGNSGGDPADFGTDALNDQGTDTQLFYPSDATYGDNFFRSGGTSGAPQSAQVSSTFDLAGRDREFAGTVTPLLGTPQSPGITAATETETAQTVSPPAATAFSDDWTGANGSSWDGAKWTTSTIGSATVDIQSNEGRFLMNGNQTRGRAVASHSAINRSEVLTKLRSTVLNNNHFAYITLRGDGLWVTTAFEEQRPRNGYFLELQTQNTGSVSLTKMVNSVRTAFTTVQYPWTLAFHWVRAEVVDSGTNVIFRAKLWLVGDPEPGAWTTSHTITGIDHASGVLQLSSLRATSGSQSVFWDDLTLSS